MSTQLVRGRTALAVGAVIASSLVMVTQSPASAAGVSDPPTAPHSIIVFPVRDFVSASGYAIDDRPIVEVVRGGFVVGTTSPLVPQNDPKTVGVFDGIVEVNHPGGGCWEGVTPDIRPNDVIRVMTTADTGDSTPTADVNVTQAATEISADSIVIKGTAVSATGGQIPVDQLEARVVANQQAFANGRRTIRASSVAGDDGIISYDGPDVNTWTATFNGLGVGADGVSDVDRAVSSQTRALWLGRAPGATAEGTIFEFGEVGGPSAPCTAPLASGPSIPDMTAATDSGTSSSDNVTSNTLPVFEGVVGLPQATAVSLYVDGVLDTTNPVVAGRYTLTPTSPLSEGEHQVSASETASGGPETMSTGSRLVTVDTAAPTTPDLTGTLPMSPGNSTHPSVTGTAELGSTITVHTDPSCSAPVASGSAVTFTSAGIGVGVTPSSTTSFFAIATDPAGNMSTCSTTSATYTHDGVAPVATAQAPVANAKAVSQTANVSTTLSEAVTGVTGTSFRLTNPAGNVVGAAVSYDPTTRVATLNPTGSLAADTTYTATLTSAVRDLAGNPTAAKVWKFTTGPTPTLTAMSPRPGRTVVSRTANLRATFSETVRGISRTTFVVKRSSTGAKVRAAVSYNRRTRVATLNPNARLAAHTRYTVTVSTGVTDAAGNPVATRTWTFTTRR